MIEFDIQKKLKASSGEMLLDVQCEIRQGEFVTLFGKSGAGKTSTIRILAGLLNPDFGKISIHGNVLLDTSNKINLPPQKREIGMVFQDYALFPNMTIFENLRFALQKNQSKKILDELIDVMEIGDLKNEKPQLLSGGQKQRVALARTLVQKPKLLLLDEPLSALDFELKTKLQKYLQRVHQEFNLTTILISHNISEIIKLSDKVCLLEKGKIIREGKPFDFFLKNKNENEIILTGELIKKIKVENQYFILVLIGNDFVKIEIDELKFHSYKLGDKISLNFKNESPSIEKLK